MGNKKHKLVGAPRFELGTSCAQGRRATRLRYAPTVTALFILKHFPTLLQIHITVFSPDCARTVARMGYCSMAGRALRRHLTDLTVHFFQSSTLHLQLHLRVLLEDLRVALSKHLRYPLVGYSSGAQTCGIG
jgi:hypothetical protein